MKTKCCTGCGVVLQTENPMLEGYIEKEKYDSDFICRRCFRLKHYNEYTVTTKNNSDYVEILKNIKNDLVLYVVDVFNLNYDMDMIFKYVSKNIVLVITKKDILPKSVKDYKLIEYFKNDKFKDGIIISSNKNFNLDLLYDMIKEYKTSNKVYIVGKTNAGKSTLINKLVKNYSDKTYDITTSCLPSTTLDMINIELHNDITLVDTPGLIDESDIINYISFKETKNITPKNEIKPQTFQMMGPTSIVVEPYFRIDSDCVNSFTFYMSNNLLARINSLKNDNLKSLKEHHIKVDYDSDIVVNGLLWIKITKKCEVTIYTYDNVLVYTRKNII